VVKFIHDTVSTVWEFGEWPEDWTSSVFIPLPGEG